MDLEQKKQTKKKPRKEYVLICLSCGVLVLDNTVVLKLTSFVI